MSDIEVLATTVPHFTDLVSSKIDALLRVDDPLTQLTTTLSILHDVDQVMRAVLPALTESPGYGFAVDRFIASTIACSGELKTSATASVAGISSVATEWGTPFALATKAAVAHPHPASLAVVATLAAALALEVFFTLALSEDLAALDAVTASALADGCCDAVAVTARVALTISRRFLPRTTTAVDVPIVPPGGALGAPTAIFAGALSAALPTPATFPASASAAAIANACFSPIAPPLTDNVSTSTGAPFDFAAAVLARAVVRASLAVPPALVVLRERVVSAASRALAARPVGAAVTRAVLTATAVPDSAASSDAANAAVAIAGLLGGGGRGVPLWDAVSLASPGATSAVDDDGVGVPFLPLLAVLQAAVPLGATAAAPTSPPARVVSSGPASKSSTGAATATPVTPPRRSGSVPPVPHTPISPFSRSARLRRTSDSSIPAPESATRTPAARALTTVRVPMTPLGALPAADSVAVWGLQNGPVGLAGSAPGNGLALASIAAAKAPSAMGGWDGVGAGLLLAGVVVRYGSTEAADGRIRTADGAELALGPAAPAALMTRLAAAVATASEAPCVHVATSACACATAVATPSLAAGWAAGRAMELSAVTLPAAVGPAGPASGSKRGAAPSAGSSDALFVTPLQSPSLREYVAAADAATGPWAAIIAKAADVCAAVAQPSTVGTVAAIDTAVAVAAQYHTIAAAAPQAPLSVAIALGAKPAKAAKTASGTCALTAGGDAVAAVALRVRARAVGIALAAAVATAQLCAVADPRPASGAPAPGAVVCAALDDACEVIALSVRVVVAAGIASAVLHSPAAGAGVVVPYATAAAAAAAVESLMPAIASAGVHDGAHCVGARAAAHAAWQRVSALRDAALSARMFLPALASEAPLRTATVRVLLALPPLRLRLAGARKVALPAMSAGDVDAVEASMQYALPKASIAADEDVVVSASAARRAAEDDEASSVDCGWDDDLKLTNRERRAASAVDRQARRDEAEAVRADAAARRAKRLAAGHVSWLADGSNGAAGAVAAEHRDSVAPPDAARMVALARGLVRGWSPTPAAIGGESGLDVLRGTTSAVWLWLLYCDVAASGTDDVGALRAKAAAVENAVNTAQLIADRRLRVLGDDADGTEATFDSEFLSLLAGVGAGLLSHKLATVHPYAARLIEAADVAASSSAAGPLPTASEAPVVAAFSRYADRDASYLIVPRPAAALTVGGALPAVSLALSAAVATANYADGDAQAMAVAQVQAAACRGLRGGSAVAAAAFAAATSAFVNLPATKRADAAVRAVGCLLAISARRTANRSDVVAPAAAAAAVPTRLPKSLRKEAAERERASAAAAKAAKADARRADADAAAARSAAGQLERRTAAAVWLASALASVIIPTGAAATSCGLIGATAKPTTSAPRRAQPTPEVADAADAALTRVRVAASAALPVGSVDSSRQLPAAVGEAGIAAAASAILGDDLGGLAAAASDGTAVPIVPNGSDDATAALAVPRRAAARLRGAVALVVLRALVSVVADDLDLLKRTIVVAVHVPASGDQSGAVPVAVCATIRCVIQSAAATALGTVDAGPVLACIEAIARVLRPSLRPALPILVSLGGGIAAGEEIMGAASAPLDHGDGMVGHMPWLRGLLETGQAARDEGSRVASAARKAEQQAKRRAGGPVAALRAFVGNALSNPSDAAGPSKGSRAFTSSKTVTSDAFGELALVSVLALRPLIFANAGLKASAAGLRAAATVYGGFTVAPALGPRSTHDGSDSDASDDESSSSSSDNASESAEAGAVVAAAPRVRRTPPAWVAFAEGVQSGIYRMPARTDGALGVAGLGLSSGVTKGDPRRKSRKASGVVAVPASAVYAWLESHGAEFRAAYQMLVLHPALALPAAVVTANPLGDATGGAVVPAGGDGAVARVHVRVTAAAVRHTTRFGEAAVTLLNDFAKYGVTLFDTDVSEAAALGVVELLVVSTAATRESTAAKADLDELTAAPLAVANVGKASAAVAAEAAASARGGLPLLLRVGATAERVCLLLKAAAFKGRTAEALKRVRSVSLKAILQLAIEPSGVAESSIGFRVALPALTAVLTAAPGPARLPPTYTPTSLAGVAAVAALCRLLLGGGLQSALAVAARGPGRSTTPAASPADAVLSAFNDALLPVAAAAHGTIAALPVATLAGADAAAAALVVEAIADTTSASLTVAFSDRAATVANAIAHALVGATATEASLAAMGTAFAAGAKPRPHASARAACERPAAPLGIGLLGVAVDLAVLAAVNACVTAGKATAKPSKKGDTKLRDTALSPLATFIRSVVHVLLPAVRAAACVMRVAPLRSPAWAAVAQLIPRLVPLYTLLSGALAALPAEERTTATAADAAAVQQCVAAMIDALTSAVVAVATAVETPILRARGGVSRSALRARGAGRGSGSDEDGDEDGDAASASGSDGPVAASRKAAAAAAGGSGSDADSGISSDNDTAVGGRGVKSPRAAPALASAPVAAGLAADPSSAGFALAATALLTQLAVSVARDIGARKCADVHTMQTVLHAASAVASLFGVTGAPSVSYTFVSAIGAVSVSAVDNATALRPAPSVAHVGLRRALAIAFAGLCGVAATPAGAAEAAVATAAAPRGSPSGAALPEGWGCRAAVDCAAHLIASCDVRPRGVDISLVGCVDGATAIVGSDADRFEREVARLRRRKAADEVRGVSSGGHRDASMSAPRKGARTEVAAGDAVACDYVSWFAQWRTALLSQAAVATALQRHIVGDGTVPPPAWLVAPIVANACACLTLRDVGLAQSAVAAVGGIVAAAGAGGDLASLVATTVMPVCRLLLSVPANPVALDGPADDDAAAKKGGKRRGRGATAPVDAPTAAGPVQRAVNAMLAVADGAALRRMGCAALRASVLRASASVHPELVRMRPLCGVIGKVPGAPIKAKGGAAVAIAVAPAEAAVGSKKRSASSAAPPPVPVVVAAKGADEKDPQGSLRARKRARSAVAAAAVEASAGADAEADVPTVTVVEGGAAPARSSHADTPVARTLGQLDVLQHLSSAQAPARRRGLRLLASVLRKCKAAEAKAPSAKAKKGPKAPRSGDDVGVTHARVRLMDTTDDVGVVPLVSAVWRYMAVYLVRGCGGYDGDVPASGSDSVALSMTGLRRLAMLSAEVTDRLAEGLDGLVSTDASVAAASADAAAPQAAAKPAVPAGADADAAAIGLDAASLQDPQATVASLGGLAAAHADALVALCGHLGWARWRRIAGALLEGAVVGLLSPTTAVIGVEGGRRGGRRVGASGKATPILTPVHGLRFLDAFVRVVSAAPQRVRRFVALAPVGAALRSLVTVSVPRAIAAADDGAVADVAMKGAAAPASDHVVVAASSASVYLPPGGTDALGLRAFGASGALAALVDATSRDGAKRAKGAAAGAASPAVARMMADEGDDSDDSASSDSDGESDADEGDAAAPGAARSDAAVGLRRGARAVANSVRAAPMRHIVSAWLPCLYSILASATTAAKADGSASVGSVKGTLRAASALSFDVRVRAPARAAGFDIGDAGRVLAASADGAAAHSARSVLPQRPDHESGTAPRRGVQGLATVAFGNNMRAFVGAVASWGGVVGSRGPPPSTSSVAGALAAGSTLALSVNDASGRAAVAAAATVAKSVAASATYDGALDGTAFDVHGGAAVAAGAASVAAAPLLAAVAASFVLRLLPVAAPAPTVATTVEFVPCRAAVKKGAAPAIGVVARTIACVPASPDVGASASDHAVALIQTLAPRLSARDPGKRSAARSLLTCVARVLGPSFAVTAVRALRGALSTGLHRHYLIAAVVELVAGIANGPLASKALMQAGDYAPPEFRLPPLGVQALVVGSAAAGDDGSDSDDDSGDDVAAAVSACVAASEIDEMRVMSLVAAVGGARTVIEKAPRGAAAAAETGEEAMFGHVPGDSEGSGSSDDAFTAYDSSAVRKHDNVPTVALAAPAAAAAAAGALGGLPALHRAAAEYAAAAAKAAKAAGVKEETSSSVHTVVVLGAAAMPAGAGAGWAAIHAALAAAAGLAAPRRRHALVAPTSDASATRDVCGILREHAAATSADASLTRRVRVRVGDGLAIAVLPLLEDSLFGSVAAERLTGAEVGHLKARVPELTPSYAVRGYSALGRLASFDFVVPLAVGRLRAFVTPLGGQEAGVYLKGGPSSADVAGAVGLYGLSTSATVAAVRRKMDARNNIVNSSAVSGIGTYAMTSAAAAHSGISSSAHAISVDHRTISRVSECLRSLATGARRNPTATARVMVRLAASLILSCETVRAAQKDEKVAAMGILGTRGVLGTGGLLTGWAAANAAPGRAVASVAPAKSNWRPAPMTGVDRAAQEAAAYEIAPAVVRQFDAGHGIGGSSRGLHGGTATVGSAALTSDPYATVTNRRRGKNRATHAVELAHAAAASKVLAATATDGKVAIPVAPVVEAGNVGVAAVVAGARLLAPTGLLGRDDALLGTMAAVEAAAAAGGVSMDVDSDTEREGGAYCGPESGSDTSADDANGPIKAKRSKAKAAAVDAGPTVLYRRTPPEALDATVEFSLSLGARAMKIARVSLAEVADDLSPPTTAVDTATRTRAAAAAGSLVGPAGDAVPIDVLISLLTAAVAAVAGGGGDAAIAAAASSPVAASAEYSAVGAAAAEDESTAGLAGNALALVGSVISVTHSAALTFGRRTPAAGAAALGVPPAAVALEVYRRLREAAATSRAASVVLQALGIATAPVVGRPPAAHIPSLFAPPRTLRGGTVRFDDDAAMGARDTMAALAASAAVLSPRARALGYRCVAAVVGAGLLIGGPAGFVALAKDMLRTFALCKGFGGAGRYVRMADADPTAVGGAAGLEILSSLPVEILSPAGVDALAGALAADVENGPAMSLAVASAALGAFRACTRAGVVTEAFGIDVAPRLLPLVASLGAAAASTRNVRVDREVAERLDAEFAVDDVPVDDEAVAAALAAATAKETGPHAAHQAGPRVEDDFTKSRRVPPPPGVPTEWAEQLDASAPFSPTTDAADVPASPAATPPRAAARAVAVAAPVDLAVSVAGTRNALVGTSAAIPSAATVVVASCSALAAYVRFLLWFERSLARDTEAEPLRRKRGGAAAPIKALPSGLDVAVDYLEVAAATIAKHSETLAVVPLLRLEAALMAVIARGGRSVATDAAAARARAMDELSLVIAGPAIVVHSADNVPAARAAAEDVMRSLISVLVPRGTSAGVTLPESAGALAALAVRWFGGCATDAHAEARAQNIAWLPPTLIGARRGCALVDAFDGAKALQVATVPRGPAALHLTAPLIAALGEVDDAFGDRKTVLRVATVLGSATATVIANLVAPGGVLHQAVGKAAKRELAADVTRTLCDMLRAFLAVARADPDLRGLSAVVPRGSKKGAKGSAAGASAGLAGESSKKRKRAAAAGGDVAVPTSATAPSAVAADDGMCSDDDDELMAAVRADARSADTVAPAKADNLPVDDGSASDADSLAAAAVADAAPTLAVPPSSKRVAPLPVAFPSDDSLCALSLPCPSSVSAATAADTSAPNATALRAAADSLRAIARAAAWPHPEAATLGLRALAVALRARVPAVSGGRGPTLGWALVTSRDFAAAADSAARGALAALAEAPAHAIGAPGGDTLIASADAFGVHAAAAAASRAFVVPRTALLATASAVREHVPADAMASLAASALHSVVAAQLAALLAGGTAPQHAPAGALAPAATQLSAVAARLLRTAAAHTRDVLATRRTGTRTTRRGFVGRAVSDVTKGLLCSHARVTAGAGVDDSGDDIPATPVAKTATAAAAPPDGKWPQLPTNLVTAVHARATMASASVSLSLVALVATVARAVVTTAADGTPASAAAEAVLVWLAERLVDVSLLAVLTAPGQGNSLFAAVATLMRPVTTGGARKRRSASSTGPRAARAAAGAAAEAPAVPADVLELFGHAHGDVRDVHGFSDSRVPTGTSVAGVQRLFQLLTSTSGPRRQPKEKGVVAALSAEDANAPTRRLTQMEQFAAKAVTRDVAATAAIALRVAHAAAAAIGAAAMSEGVSETTAAVCWRALASAAVVIRRTGCA